MSEISQVSGLRLQTRMILIFYTCGPSMHRLSWPKWEGKQPKPGHIGSFLKKKTTEYAVFSLTK